MSTVEGAETAVAVEQAGARVRRGRAPRPLLAGTWWRHLIAIVAIVFAVFPVAYIASAAFSADGTLTGASLIPRDVTLDNFRTILSRRGHGRGRRRATSPTRAGTSTRSSSR